MEKRKLRWGGLGAREMGVGGEEGQNHGMINDTNVERFCVFGNGMFWQEIIVLVAVTSIFKLLSEIAATNKIL